MARNFLAIIPFFGPSTTNVPPASVNKATVSNAHAGFIMSDKSLNEDDDQDDNKEA